MTAEFGVVEWDETTIDDCRHLIRLAIREDLRQGFDGTTVGLVDSQQRGAAALVARHEGVVCGVRAAKLVLTESESRVEMTSRCDDGDAVSAGTVIAELAGNARDMLTMERILLNFLGRLSGVATHTAAYVRAVAGTSARIYDTRKTTPAFRRLEKYAVRCGGGFNHREGLFDAILIKDNHLALANTTVAEAVDRARRLAEASSDGGGLPIIEVEVDSLDQLRDALTARPDIVLLDNMTSNEHREAIRLRDELAAATKLEASGGITLQTIRAIAETGIDRISVGDLTHSAPNFDIGLDWPNPS